MRLSRQAVVEVRKSSNWVPRAPRGYCYKRVLHACIGSRMQWYEELVEEQRQDQASFELCDAVAPPVPVPAANAFAAFSFQVLEDAFGDTSASEIQTESSVVLSFSDSFSVLVLPQEHHMTSPPQ